MSNNTLTHAFYIDPNKTVILYDPNVEAPHTPYTAVYPKPEEGEGVEPEYLPIQMGDPKDGVNGLTVDAQLATLIHQLLVQYKDSPDDFLRGTIDSLDAALSNLHDRSLFLRDLSKSNVDLTDVDLVNSKSKVAMKQAMSRRLISGLNDNKQHGMDYPEIEMFLLKS